MTKKETSSRAKCSQEERARKKEEKRRVTIANMRSRLCELESAAMGRTHWRVEVDGQKPFTAAATTEGNKVGATAPILGKMRGITMGQFLKKCQAKRFNVFLEVDDAVG